MSLAYCLIYYGIGDDFPVCPQTWNENKGDQVLGFIYGQNTVGDGGK